MKKVKIKKESLTGKLSKVMMYAVGVWSVVLDDIDP